MPIVKAFEDICRRR